MIKHFKFNINHIFTKPAIVAFLLLVLVASALSMTLHNFNHQDKYGVVTLVHQPLLSKHKKTLEKHSVSRIEESNGYISVYFSKHDVFSVKKMVSPNLFDFVSDIEISTRLGSVKFKDLNYDNYIDEGELVSKYLDYLMPKIIDAKKNGIVGLAANRTKTTGIAQHPFSNKFALSGCKLLYEQILKGSNKSYRSLVIHYAHSKQKNNMVYCNVNYSGSVESSKVNNKDLFFLYKKAANKTLFIPKVISSDVFINAL